MGNKKQNQTNLLGDCPPTLDAKETEKLLSELYNGNGHPYNKRKRIRNYTMAVLMLDAGLRVGEVVHMLKTDLVILEAPVHAITVRAEIAKNKRERTVPITNRIAIAIEEMMAYYWKPFKKEPVVFAFFNNICYRPLSKRIVQEIIRKAGYASLGRPIHPHVLRHTFASRMMRVTNQRVVQQLLGHKSITSTQVYTHPNGDDLRKAIKDLETKDS